MLIGPCERNRYWSIVEESVSFTTNVSDGSAITVKLQGESPWCGGNDDAAYPDVATERNAQTRTGRLTIEASSRTCSRTAEGRGSGVRAGRSGTLTPRPSRVNEKRVLGWSLNGHTPVARSPQPCRPGRLN